MAPPLYTCGTGALGRLRGPEPGLFPDTDRVLLTAAGLELDQAERQRLSRLPIAGLQGGWYGGYPPPSWPGMAASCLPWIFPALHREDTERFKTP